MHKHKNLIQWCNNAHCNETQEEANKSNLYVSLVVWCWHMQKSASPNSIRISWLISRDSETSWAMHLGLRVLKKLLWGLILTDTDSVCYQLFCIFTDNLASTTDAEVTDFIDHLITKYVHNIDRSNYPKDHKLYDASKKKHLHYYKREVPPPNYIAKIIAVNPKEYFVVQSDSKTIKKHKGVHRNTGIRQNQYLDRLASATEILGGKASVEVDKTTQS